MSPQGISKYPWYNPPIPLGPSGHERRRVWPSQQPMLRHWARSSLAARPMADTEGEQSPAPGTTPGANQQARSGCSQNPPQPGTNQRAPLSKTQEWSSQWEPRSGWTLPQSPMGGRSGWISTQCPIWCPPGHSVVPFGLGGLVPSNSPRAREQLQWTENFFGPPEPTKILVPVCFEQVGTHPRGYI